MIRSKYALVRYSDQTNGYIIFGEKSNENATKLSHDISIS